LHIYKFYFSPKTPKVNKIFEDDVKAADIKILEGDAFIELALKRKPLNTVNRSKNRSAK